MTIKNIEKSIKQLSPVQRIQIVENILESLHTPDPEVEKAWIAESERRLAAYKKGKVKGIPWEVVQKRLAR